MPELPPTKRKYDLSLSQPLAQAVASPVRYAELHCLSNFSFLEGASHPDELVEQAVALQLSALAITDRNSLAGVVRAHVAAKARGFKLLIGAEITPTDAPPVVLWAMNRSGYGKLCRLITRGRRHAPKGACRLTLSEIAEHSTGLLAGIMLSSESVDRSLATSATFDSQLLTLAKAFGDRCYGVAELHRGADDRRRLHRWLTACQSAGLPVIAANGVHYHVRERQPLQDVLTAIRHGCTVEQLGERRFANAERHLKSSAEMLRLFADCPAAVARTAEIADRCSFSLDELKYEYPEELCPPQTTPIQHLINLTWRGAKGRYPRGIPDKVRRLIEHELKLIDELNYAAYFLTVWDLVRFARERGILCQGRGSAANSAVCFCLGVTSVDPDRIDVLFERFISRERNEAPDIDVDFEHERREEVIQYLYDKYGRDRAGMTAEAICYRSRSAIRDVGKALGLSLDRVDALAKQVDHSSQPDQFAARLRDAGLPPESRLGRQLQTLVTELLDFPRHLSQHVGGMVLTNGPLCEVVPIENATMPGRTVIEWDKDDLDSLGILKVDVLALGMLTAIRKCFDLVARHHHRKLTLATVPASDYRVFDMIGRSDTMGVFQIESRAQMSMLPRLKPRCFYDLVIEVAIVRPGPIQGDMVHPYLRRRCGQEAVEYPDDRIRAVLEKTLGVPIFQEQAMKLVVVAAGFTPGEADQLRRAMGAWRRRGVIDQFRQKLLDGMIANGYSTDFADRVFRQLRGFGEYGFPESHAASFAVLVWVSAWLKYHYPAAFAAALLNSQPMGFYAPAQLVADTRKHGVTVLPVDVNLSYWDCTLERPAADKPVVRQGRLTTSYRSNACSSLPMVACSQKNNKPGVNDVAIRLGFRMLSGFAAADADTLVSARGSRPFVSMDDFFRRTGLGNSVATRLSRADAFRSLQLNRRESLWQALPDPVASPLLDRPISQWVARPESSKGVNSDHALRDASGRATQSLSEHNSDQVALEIPADIEPLPELPRLSEIEEVVSDYRTVGLSLRDHPMKFLRPRLHDLHVVPAWKLATWPNGKRVTVAGLVLLRQRPSTANGVTFVTLEDETGMANLIVRRDVWEQHRQAARTASVMLATGPLQREGQVIHILAHELRDLSTELAALHTRSRDFR